MDSVILFSHAAAVKTGNWLAGAVIMEIQKRSGPIQIKEIGNTLGASYSQTRTALEKLEQSGLLYKQKHMDGYKWNEGHPEALPLMYILTEDGQKCVTPNDNTLKAQTEQKNTKQYQGSNEGLKIAKRSGLIDKNGDISLIDLDYKTQFLSQHDKDTLKDFLSENGFDI